MRTHDVTYLALAKEEEQLKEEGKQKRAARTPRKRERRVMPVRTAGCLIQSITSMCKRSSVGCLEYQGSRDSCGYGKFRFGRESLAHRVMFVAHGGTIPAGKYVCHGCDNPRCVELTHLFIGTQKENMRDCFSKGRRNQAKGQRVNTCVLTPEQVQECRKAYSENMRTFRVKRGLLKELATKFSVNRSTIYVAVAGKSWKHLTQTPGLQ